MIRWGKCMNFVKRIPRVTRQQGLCLRKRSQESQSFDMEEDAGGLRALLPSSLVLSPLWETCPPLDGPGVPTEGVEWASSMSLQDAGFWEVRERSTHQGTGDKEREERREERGEIDEEGPVDPVWGPLCSFPKTQRQLSGMISIARQEPSCQKCEPRTTLPFCPTGRFKYSCRERVERSKSSEDSLAALQHVNPPVSWLCLWPVLGRNPVFIGPTGPATRTALSPRQTADLPLQPLGVSCLPDGDQMKSLADDNKKRGDKGAVWMRPLTDGPSFLIQTHNNYNSSVHTATQRGAMCLHVYQANEGLISSQSICSNPVSRNGGSCTCVTFIYRWREFYQTFMLMFTMYSSFSSYTIIQITHCNDWFHSYTKWAAAAKRR